MGKNDNKYYNLDTTTTGLLAKPDYDKVNENLRTMFTNRSDQDGDDVGAESYLTSSYEQFRYQNVTTESYGYMGRNVNVRPYGIAKHNFVAQFDNELGVNQGDMVYLKKYVDNEWLFGEIDESRRGLIPISYVNVIVDCVQEEIKQSAVTVHENLTVDTFHKVLYTFQAQIEGDLSVVEGEVIRIKEQRDQDWVVVENSMGESGLCPGNHLDPLAEFGGNAQFDIERLLTYKAQPPTASVTATHSAAANPRKNSNNDLKFFDPLCSPDNDMLMIEAELERKVSETNKMTLLEAVAAKRMEQLQHLKPPTQERKVLETKPKDINSAISANLAKLSMLKAEKSMLSSSTNSSKPNNANLNSDSLDISKSVLYELRGSTKAQKKKPAPPRPAQPPKRRSDGENSGKPVKPPPPQSSALLMNFSEDLTKKSKFSDDLMSLSSEQPIYATVDKKVPTRKPPPRPVKSQESQHKYDEVNVEDKDPSPHKYDEVSRDFAEKPKRPESLLQHKYDEVDESLFEESKVDNKTPTNEKNFQEQPKPPSRSFSLKPIRGEVATVQTKASFVSHVKDFPPDKKSPMSPPPTENPPKIQTLPYRCDSVASSSGGRSKFYASAASIDSSLNHSYETLNMSDTTESITNVAPVAPRLPHRPAPPVPSLVPSFTMTAKEREYLQQHLDDQILQEEVERMAKYSTPRAKTKHPNAASKRTLRQRKIHSVKRQIQIKEKMLEVIELVNA